MYELPFAIESSIDKLQTKEQSFIRHWIKSNIYFVCTYMCIYNILYISVIYVNTKKNLVWVKQVLK